MCSCGNSPEAYKVVQNLSQMRSIPCDERIIGMTVVVVGSKYKKYQLEGGDPCNNNNWKSLEFSVEDIQKSIGHKTIVENLDSELITKEYLNNRFPTSMEGFMVTVISLNTTFLKIEGGSWRMLGSFKIEDADV